VLGELGELGGPVAAGKDPGVDGRVERLDAAADERRDVGERRHREYVDPIGEEVFPGSVRGIEFNVEAGEVAGKRADPIAIRDR
jgi:hypothetical protein